MISRRTLLTSLVAVPLAGCNSVRSSVSDTKILANLSGSYARDPYEARDLPQDDVPKRPPSLSRDVVRYDGAEAPGTIVVRTGERKLYFVLDEETAIQYPVGVGRAGKQWQGRAEIDGAYVHPTWAPTPEIKRDNPDIPDLIPGGAPNNPMGARALTLSGGEYAIHGTNRPESIGTYASYGCIRMFNDDIVDLFGRVRVGAQVVVTA